MKKIFLLILAALAGLGAHAKTIYLNTGGASLWNQADAVFFVHSWKGETENPTDLQMTHTDGDIFEVSVPDENDKILFVRMPNGSTSLNWDNLWNKTEDQTIANGNNMFTITGWRENAFCDGSWSVYNAQDGGGIQGGGEDNGSLEGWFYKGYIDSKNVEPSAATKFVKGIASFACTEKSYIFVLYQDANGGVQYMTRGYHEGLTHQTMCKGLENETGENKGDSMPFEPGMYTLYLYDNEDGTYELSVEELKDKKLVGAETNALEEVTYTLDTQAPMYNIMGMQVSPSYKGIILQNGHKFIRN